MAEKVQKVSLQTKIGKWPGLPGLIIITGLLTLGLCICKDYGVSWDEMAQREIGNTNLQYIRTGDDKLMEHFADKDHGAAFEVPLKWIEEVITPAEMQSVFLIRHICTYIFFLIGVWCAYLLALRLYRQQWIALLGIAMLVLAPRIFAHSFLNSKDIPFLSAMLIAIYASHAMFESRRAYLYLLAGMACGFATGIRTMGGLLGLITGVLLTIDIITSKDKKNVIIGILLYVLGTAGMLYLCWPSLWHHPIDNLVDSYKNLSHFTRWGGSLLFNGKNYLSTELPWYYIPVWLCISTPVFWLVLGIAGIVTPGIRFIKRPGTFFLTAKGRVLLLCVGCFLLPIIAVIMLHSVLYDDWRHLYFIYGPFVILALFAAEQIGAYRKGKVVIMLGTGIQLVITGVFMVSAHPFQQVYFNGLVSHKPEYLRHHYDYEYWGASFKQGLDYILAHDSRDSIPVINSLPPLMDNWKGLTANQRQRIKWVEELRDGAYFLTIYRNHPEDFPFRKVHGIQVGNSTVMQIYRIDSTITQ